MADASRRITATDAPVRVPPAGNMFLLGLSNGFDTTYPMRLTGKVAPEEFAATVGKVNAVLERDVPHGVAWFLAGYLVCVCTLGLSLAPALYRRDQVLKAVRQVLEEENTRIYHQLNVHWSIEQGDDRSAHDLVLLIDTAYRPPKGNEAPSPLMLPL